MRLKVLFYLYGRPLYRRVDDTRVPVSRLYPSSRVRHLIFRDLCHFLSFFTPSRRTHPARRFTIGMIYGASLCRDHGARLFNHSSVLAIAEKREKVGEPKLKPIPRPVHRRQLARLSALNAQRRVFTERRGNHKAEDARAARAAARRKSLSFSLFLALPRSSSFFLSPCSPIRKKSLLREIRAERSLIVSRMYADIIEVTTSGLRFCNVTLFLGISFMGESNSIEMISDNL